MAQTTVILKNVKLYWADLFQPAKDFKDEKTGRITPGQYTATVIFDPASDAGKLATGTFAAVAKEEFGPNFATIVDAIDPKKKCIRNGNHRLDEEGNIVEGFAGKLYLSSKNKMKPVVIDDNLAPLKDDTGRIFRGCMVNVKVEISAFTSKISEVGRMVGAKVLAVQYAGEGDGTTFGSAPPTADGFEALAGSTSPMDGDAAAMFN